MTSTCGCGPTADAARSGLMALTGHRDGPPLTVPPGVITAARKWATDLARLTDGKVDLDGPAVLGARAAAEGLERRAPWSVGGHTRAVRTADGWMAVSLARETDRAAVGAVVSAASGNGDPWVLLGDWAATRSTHEAVARTTLLELPSAAVPLAPVGSTGRPGVVSRVMPGTGTRCRRRPDDAGAPGLVVDLSALWAGPLCAHVLGLAGHRVVKVESADRLDASRWGNAEHYAVLHAGQESVVLDFTAERGREQLRELVGLADIVIEASRPRALRALGVDPEGTLGEGATWVAITAYGREADAGMRVGFGDDVAAGAGAWVRDPSTGEPIPAGDALADPLTGLAAAVAALEARARGGRELLDVSMAAVVAEAVGQAVTPVATAATERAGRWFVTGEHGCEHEVLAPRSPRGPGGVADPGADTARVLAELGLPA
ncbi:CoA transferase [Janibacter sp. G1551]|uniref:CoA transferase n=1 Tax=Janibacter sp. G1551 TaxID=3420440 RepID=UPI003D04F8E2